MSEDTSFIKRKMNPQISRFDSSMYSSGNINNNIDEFKEPDYIPKFKCFIQKTFHFKQDIERVWMVIKNFDILSLIQNQGHYPCVSIKGEDTWTIGNTFKGNFFGIYPFTAKVQKSINFPESKKIKWLFHIKDHGYSSLKLELFKLTEDDSTVVWRKGKYEDEDFKKGLEELLNDNEGLSGLYEFIEKYLEEKAINLLKYESGIISGKMEDIWNFVLDFNNFNAIAPNNKFLPNINIKEMKVGEKINSSVFFGDKIKDVEIFLKNREAKEGWNKWIILCEISGKGPNKIQRQTILLQLTKINEEECQLALITKYHEPVNNEEFQELSKKKKYLLISLKDYFENFYSPNSSE